MSERSIIKKLGITSGHYESKCKLGYVATGIELSESDFETVFVESKEMKRIKDSAPEMLEHLIKIVKAQNDKNATLANLNGAINNAKEFLLKKYPEIKELI